MDRKIGEYTGKDRGPLVICIGGIHGNEIAGIKALEIVLQMLEKEPTRNPDFKYRGRFIAMRGNLEAVKEGKRFIDKDLNRNFLSDRLNNLVEPEFVEDQEAMDMIRFIQKEVATYKPPKLLIIDLHTTSSPGGIFTIVTEDQSGFEIAKSMHAPVILGMASKVKGTVMDYFKSEKLGLPTKAIVFESGQHEDPNSITLAIAAIIAALRSIGSVAPQDVESHHDKLLIEFSENLPNLTKLVMKHPIQKGDGFRMKPGYLNFQSVRKGEVVAEDVNGNIIIPEDGLILMPLYQDQGEDGFFLIQKIEEDAIY